MGKFVHLHVHSEFSLLDGLAKIKDLLKRTKELGMDSIALTDHGSMYGIIKFYQEALNQGVKPIVGVETYIARRSRLDKDGAQDTDPYHLVLLAQNNQGYQNLLKIITIANLEGFYYKPRIDYEVLSKFHEGLIALSGCLQGEVSNLLLSNELHKAKEKALFYQSIFGENNYFLELQNHPDIKEQEDVNKKIIVLSREVGIPLVATNDSHYVNKEDADAQEVLLCVQTQKTLLDKNRPLSMIQSPDFYLKSPEEMISLFREHPEAILNTLKIAEKCNINISLGKWILPNFEVPDKETPSTYLQSLCQEKVKNKFENLNSEIQKRLDYELDIIDKKGYAAYFLIVADFVNWAKSQKIAVGPGRGSAAGSLVAYVLGITGINPFFFKLPFERFLNPFRPSPPDIDLDFADDRRDEVIAYVTNKYGDDKVAQIITFGTMEARQAIRDVGRVLGMPYSIPDRIAKMIPPGAQGFSMTIEKALQIVPELLSAYQSEKDIKRLLDLAVKLEGVARHSSTHAAGVVIADKPLEEYTPLQKESKGEKIITQYDMYTVGENGIGLLKMDFLGLRNLTIIQNALDFIKQTENIDIDLSKAPLDDKITYELLSKGNTTGIFQLESAGMRRYIKELKPTSIFDLMAMVALFRPGPMQVIPEFIARKHNPDLITYPHPKLKEVLNQSYGLITYQDDVLLTAITLAGYSWGDADKLRKAVGKKIPSEMKKQKEKFIEGCLSNDIKLKKAEEIFKLIEPFAGYGFNKAHAACYGTIAYQTAFLKAHYPVEFMTALLSAESHNSGPTRDEKVARAVDECRKMGILINKPDINKSLTEFSIEIKGKDKSIRYALGAIKNIGPASIDSMISARNNEGEFKGIADFCSRVDLSKVNKKTLESLIKSGAMDNFGKRSSLLASLDELIQHSHEFKKQQENGQTSLFSDHQKNLVYDLKLKDLPELPHEQLLKYERELLGFFLTEHPFSDLLESLSKNVSILISDISIEDHSGRKVQIGGLVTSVRKIITKNGSNEMAFIQLEDLSGAIEVVVFPKLFSSDKEIWRLDNIIMVTGKVNDRDDRLSIIAEQASIYTPDNPPNKNILETNKNQALIIFRVSDDADKNTLSRLKSLLQGNPGDDIIQIIIPDKKNSSDLSLNFKVKLTEKLKTEIEILTK